jgi:glycogen(starch) synthase
MNVLLTTDAFPPGSGGSGRSTATLAAALAGRGHRVRVIVGRKVLKGQTEWEGIAISEVSIPASTLGSRARERAYAAGLSRAMGDEVWDVVHAQHWLSAMATHAACRSLPRVITVRDYWPVCIWSTMLSGSEPCPGCSYARRVVCVGRRRPWLWPVAPLLPPLVGADLDRRRRVLSDASAVVAVSRHVAQTLPLDNSHVIPNFIGSSAEDVECARPEDVPERYVLFVGKLEPNKAPDRLVPILDEAGCDLPLVIAGSGSLSESLRAAASRRGRDVRLLGWVNDDRALALMQHASAVLFPSRWQEPLSRVLVDGLSVGAVLVVQPTGGSADAVVHEASGLLGDGVQALGAELARVLADGALAKHLREGAKVRAKEHFSETVVLPQLEAVYREVTTS